MNDDVTVEPRSEESSRTDPARPPVTTPVIEALLAAVPSFAAPWAKHVADQAEYEASFPDSAATASEIEFDFLNDLARHLGRRLREREGLREVSAVLSALEPLYLDADQALADRLTITLLEGVILAVHASEGPLPALDRAAAAGPELVAAEYRSARSYLRGSPGATGSHWVRD